ncbi:HEPN/Toprim-associated domain-containing protein [Citrobacter sp. Ca225]|uniref:HEPN/Toprim-associated domain-containing protein n=1 Tax=Citrobacter sp. Ca225 TaxID=2985002 RepID=UPI00257AB33B|nr:HEPN/Toprim-associated domain-containing protein [Citrobacter sp. Ca225]MDM3520627.1 HEPN/Toprim-associated domain-containing protein [Citrobacter sp. Ca225]
MGTVISLSVSGVDVTWSKNSLGIDHGELFQSKDHYIRPLDSEELEEGEELLNDPEHILFRTVLRRPLGDVLRRLELLGYTLGTARAEYDLMVKKYISDRDGYISYAHDSTNAHQELMSFDEFVSFIKLHNLSELDGEYVNLVDRNENKSRVRGRFTDENVLKRIPFYQNEFESAWSEKNGFGNLINILHPYSVLRVLAENESNRNEFVEWDYGALVSNGWANLNDVVAGASRLSTFLIATEGSSDSNILEKALELLRPDIKDYFKFIDMKSGHPFPGTGNLLKFADGLVKIDVQNLIVFVLDNDCEGIEAFNKIQSLNLPDNMSCMHLPDLDDFCAFPAHGPHGITNEDVNGRAVAIECYLDLTLTDYEPAIIRWTNYKKELKNYQGSLENKDYYTKKFMALRENSQEFEGYDFSKISKVLDEMIATCSKIAVSIRHKQLEAIYPEV